MISLVPTSPQYAELWQQWRQEPNSIHYNPIVGSDLEGLRRRMQSCSSDLSNLKAAEEFQFFIQWTGQLVGTVSLKNVSFMMSYGEIGYGVGEEYQGKGIGSEGIRTFVSKIFSETSLRRLFAYVAEDNFASRRLLEKNGFEQEGICREHYIINGTPTNEVLYGLLRQDWEKGNKFSSPEITKKYRGMIVEESLEDPTIINNISIQNVQITSPSRWHIYTVSLSKEQIDQYQKFLKRGPWYMHFWRGDDIVAVFKDKTFHLSKNDKGTWLPAIAYGKSIGIPEEQLDFLTEGK
ncbi:MAG TPA: GNAT family protein [Pseudobdellovibrionaceae bacterium]|jgi:RimJ/RimL family protein N-acetyltransferase